MSRLHLRIRWRIRAGGNWILEPGRRNRLVTGGKLGNGSRTNPRSSASDDSISPAGSKINFLPYGSARQSGSVNASLYCRLRNALTNHNLATEDNVPHLSTVSRVCEGILAIWSLSYSYTLEKNNLWVYFPVEPGYSQSRWTIKGSQRISKLRMRLVPKIKCDNEHDVSLAQYPYTHCNFRT